MISTELKQEIQDSLEHANWDKDSVIARLGGYDTKEPHYDLIDANLSDPEQDKQAGEIINFIEGL